MRLVCPNCDAQYEVPSGVIPEEGRDVQCSNCGNTWFQAHPDAVPPDADPDPAPEDIRAQTVRQDPPPVQEAPPPVPEPEPAPEPAPEPDPEPAPAAAAPQRQTIAPAVANVLREEAEREARAREEETRRSQIETQPDLGLEAASESEEDRRSREARNRMARMRGEPTEPSPAEKAAAAGPRRNMLPDIDDINATLRSSKEPRAADQEEGETAAEAPRRSGFSRGFALMLLLAVILVSLYAYAPRIAAAVPQLKAPLATYVQTVETGRTWLDGKAEIAIRWLDSMASEEAGDG